MSDCVAARSGVMPNKTRVRIAGGPDVVTRGVRLASEDIDEPSFDAWHVSLVRTLSSCYSRRSEAHVDRVLDVCDAMIFPGTTIVKILFVDIVPPFFR
jgi:hypothetical protein